MRRRLPALLAHAALPYALALLAMALTLPALRVGWQFDDYYQREVLLSAADPRVSMHYLFAFMDGDPARTRYLMDTGAFPWWTLPEAREAFWRPLSALTHWVDYQLWPASPGLMHAHSLLWFGLLIAAVTAFYRRLWAGAVGGLALAGLAALLYAVDDAHGWPVGWLANRNGLLAPLFGVLCLTAYVRWRRDGWRLGAFLAPLWLALALLSAEAALGTLAYLAAYTLWLDRGPWRRRLMACLPLALVVGAWALAYRALGFGAWGTSYVDPAREPLVFARLVLERAPLLLAGQWLGVPVEVVQMLGPVGRSAVWGVAMLAALALAGLLAPLVRRSALARFWATGMLLALLPISAAIPGNRLLFFAGLGGMGLLAQWLAEAWPATPAAGTKLRTWRALLQWGRGSGSSHPGTPSPAHRVSFFAAAGLVVIHLGLSPLLLPVLTYSPKLLGGLDLSSLSLPPDPALTAQTVVVVTAPTFFSASFIAPIRARHGLPVPAQVRYLGGGLAAHTLTRPDAYTLEVRPDDGYLKTFATVFRGPHHPLQAGDTVALAGVTVRVLELTRDGRPAAAAFRFAVPLEDAALRWVEWRGGAFVPLALPAVGQTVRLPALAAYGLENLP